MKKEVWGLLRKVVEAEYGWSGSIWLVLECGHTVQPSSPMGMYKAKQRIGHRARCASCLLDQRGRK